MNFMLTALLALQILCAIAMTGLILLQHGKGADMGAAFGGGSSGSLFGASGSANFLSHATAVLAAIFFASTLLLAYFGNVAQQPVDSGSVLERVLPSTQAPAPARAPAPVETGPATQIPGTTMPAPQGQSGTPSTTAPAPAVPASGAAQIPTR